MKKIHTLYILLIGATLLLLSSCQAADNTLGVIDPSANTDELAGALVQLDASSFALPEAGTRATAANFPINGSTMTVGMTVEGVTTYTNYTYNGTAWTADATEGNKALRWQDGSLDHSFIAVSPSRDMSNLNYSLPSAYTAENLADYDGLLTTTAAVLTKPTKSIALAMKHALVKITILSAANSVVLKGQTLATAFNTETGALTEVSHAGAVGEITMHKSGPVYVGYVLPRTAEEQLTYTSAQDMRFPAATAMPGGGNFVCSEGLTIITSTAGELKAELEKNTSAEILYINGVVNSTDMTDLRSFLLREGCTVKELYLDADGTEKIENAFYNGSKGCETLVKVTLFKTTEMGVSSFRSCNSLTTVSLPNLIKITGMSIFDSCIRLTDVDMPNLKTLGAGWIFNKCGALEKIYLPSLENPYDNMFAECTKLKTVILPNAATMPARLADSPALTTVVLKNVNVFNKAALNAAAKPVLFVVSEYLDSDALGTALTGKQYPGTTAYSNYQNGIMTADNLINPANYSVTWNKD